MKDRFQGATKEAAVRRVLNAGWNSATSENSSEEFSSPSDFFEDFEQLRLNIFNKIFVEEVGKFHPAFGGNKTTQTDRVHVIIA